MWEEHFKNLLGKSPNATDKLITKIIRNQVDIKQGQFSQEELNIVQAKIKNRKVAGPQQNTLSGMEDKEIR